MPSDQKKSIRKFWREFRDEDVVLCVGVYQPDLQGNVRLAIANDAGHGSLITIGIGFAMTHLRELMGREICGEAKVELITSEISRSIGDTNWISIGSARANDRTSVLRSKIEETFDIDWTMKWDQANSTMNLHGIDGTVLSSNVDESNGRTGIDYALIVKAPYQDDKWAVLIGGCKTYGIWAAAEALKDEKFLEKIVQATKGRGDVPVSIVLKTAVVSGIPQEPQIHTLDILKTKNPSSSGSDNPLADLKTLLDERTNNNDITQILFRVNKQSDDFVGDTKATKWLEILTYFNNREILPELRDAICNERLDLCDQVSAFISKIIKKP